MQELLKTTDPALVNAATAYLKAEGIRVFDFDVHMSIVEGSIGIFPRRLMVQDEDAAEARRILALLDIETTPPPE